MNNTELALWFRTITNNNGLDMYEALRDKNNKRKYKQSEFYKKTRLSFKAALTAYSCGGYLQLGASIQTPLMQGILNGNSARVNRALASFVEKVDPTILDSLLSKLTSGILENNIATMGEDLQGAQAILKEFMHFGK